MWENHRVSRSLGAAEVDLGVIQRSAGSNQERTGACERSPGRRHTHGPVGGPSNKQAGEKRVGKVPHEVDNKTMSDIATRLERMGTKEKTIVFGKKKVIMTLVREVSIKLWGWKSAVKEIGDGGIECWPPHGEFWQQKEEESLEIS